MPLRRRPNVCPQRLPESKFASNSWWSSPSEHVAGMPTAYRVRFWSIVFWSVHVLASQQRPEREKRGKIVALEGYLNY